LSQHKPTQSTSEARDTADDAVWKKQNDADEKAAQDDWPKLREIRPEPDARGLDDKVFQIEPIQQIAWKRDFAQAANLVLAKANQKSPENRAK
jgi:hypothetical protein